jgi:hypothetical protein
MNAIWGPIEMSNWASTPCLRGRIALEQDVKDEKAVFFFGNPEEIFPQPVDVELPRCAIHRETNAPIIVIQCERADEKCYAGYRFLSGGNGLGFFEEIELLDGPDERFDSAAI